PHRDRADKTAGHRARFSCRLDQTVWGTSSMQSIHPQRNLLAAAVLAGLVALSQAPVAQAQDAQPAAGDREEQPTTLATMTVTAQKREEALQDVPIVVNVLPEQLLLDTGVRDIKDMQVLVPGLTVTSTQSAA